MNFAVAVFLLVFLGIVIGYLIGSVMFADIIGYFLRKNPRYHGSRNPGTTNSIRVFGMKYGVIVGLLDIVKGLLPFLITLAIYRFWLQNYLGSNLNSFPTNRIYFLTYLSSFASIIGHIWPVFFKFKGGKAVATTVGLLLSTSVWWFVIIAIVWWAIALKTKYVSLASLISFAIFPILNLIPWLGYMHWFNLGSLTYLTYQTDWPTIVFFEVMILGLTALVFWLHRGNIQRLRTGTERKVTQKIKG
ncbi:glycerol-3-phosphate 1-O-acyltransferase PlsY [[Mycoplasma] testudinis]|uniref:glycerol-3-phosphate 1-O-acyltransferase PlsY n=1 Tax=[Mycoplasma] testudinis TaxID=33924 RepID=UPI000485EA9B|nr:glycerol-3-phosphate 1-O-acyltransferase PlsY [[Mycoplasma] testudinis]